MFEFKFSFIPPIKLFRRVDCLSNLKTEPRFEQSSWRKLISKTLRFASFALRALRKNGYAP